MAPWQETAAVQDLGPAYDRYGSFATEAVEATRACMSAFARKRTSSGSSRYVRLVPLADSCGAAKGYSNQSVECDVSLLDNGLPFFHFGCEQSG
jgi:hypothetical protein